MKNFNELSDQTRSGDFSGRRRRAGVRRFFEGLRENYAGSAAVFDSMREEESETPPPSDRTLSAEVW